MYLLLLLMLIILISILHIYFRLKKDIDSYIFKHRDRPTYSGRQLYDNFDVEFLRRKVNSRRSKF